MVEQSWVMQSRDRSVNDETPEMQQGAENRRRVLGSTLFGSGDSPSHSPPPRQNAPMPSYTYLNGESYDASDNRKKVMGSSIFSDNSPQLGRYDPPPAQPTGAGNSPTYNEVNNSPGFDARVRFSSTMPITQPFPDLAFEGSPPMENFSLSFKPHAAVRQNAGHRLEVPPNPQMRQLRDELNRDTEEFARRLRQIGRV